MSDRSLVWFSEDLPESTSVYLFPFYFRVVAFVLSSYSQLSLLSQTFVRTELGVCVHWAFYYGMEKGKGWGMGN